MNSRDEDLEGKTVQDAMNNINPEYFEWLKEISNFSVSRTLEICTFILNMTILQNYFNWVKEINKNFPFIISDNLNDQKIKQFNVTYEKIYGIFILMNMTYHSDKQLNRTETDIAIDRLISNSIKTAAFFIINLFPPEMDSLMSRGYLKGFNLQEKIFPKLEFDPEFKKILEHDAIKKLYDTSFITDYLEPITPQRVDKYPIDLQLAKKIFEIYKKPHLTVFDDLDPKLGISNFNKKGIQYMGAGFLSNKKQIEDIINLLRDYLSLRCPSKKEEIENFLPCFGILFKFLKGRLYEKFRYVSIEKKIRNEFDKEIARKFFDKFCFHKENHSFDETFENFNPKSFINRYHNFLRYACYRDTAYLYTGLFLVWRALLKFMENIQNDEEFKLNKKGSLLEKWCYEKAIKYGFQPEKIVLINPNKDPTLNYSKMLKQTEDYPRPRIEFIVEFPSILNDFYFQEIDFVIKISNYLFLFECKGTVAPLSEEGNYIEWVDNFFFNLELLKQKAFLIKYNIDKGNLSETFFQGINKFIPTVIQTEGLLFNNAAMNMEGYEKFLEKMRIAIDKNKFKEFMESNTKLL